MGNEAAEAVFAGAAPTPHPPAYIPYHPVEGPPGNEVQGGGGGGGGGAGCAQQGYWAVHPEECLREVYGHSLKVERIFLEEQKKIETVLVCVCVCVCLYIYIFIHVYVHVYIYMYILLYMHIYI
jgi:hypothetical protein